MFITSIAFDLSAHALIAADYDICLMLIRFVITSENPLSAMTLLPIHPLYFS